MIDTKHISAFVIFCFPALMFGQTNDCDGYKTGKFVIKDEKSTSYIKRNKKFQIEKVFIGENKVKTKSKIVWLNKCSYKLIPLKINDPRGIVTETVMIFTIVETSDNYYLVRVTGYGNIAPIFKVYIK